jgi:ankyrin repeat protein
MVKKTVRQKQQTEENVGNYPPIINVPRDEFDNDMTYAIRREDIWSLENMVRKMPDIFNTEIRAYILEGSHTVYPIFFAAINNKLHSLKFMANHGANIDSSNINGYTPLFIASRNNHIEIVKYLLSAGADVNKVDTDGETPLYIASQNGHIEIVSLLVENRADINKATKSGYTPLYGAVTNGHLEIARFLIEHGADVNKYDIFPPIYQACTKGHLDIARLLIAHGVDVNKASVNAGKWVPLHAAAFKGYLEIVRALISAGADINKRAWDGASSLFFASRVGHLEIVKILIENGANINTETKNGISPLNEASSKGHFEIVRFLVEHGSTITPNIINNAATPEIKEYLNAKYYEGRPMWKGFTKGDFEKFNSIFDPENPSAMSNVSVCPVCLKYVERSEACNYMSHNCSTAGYYHSELYDKYKNTSGFINWCTICGRICKGHNHYPLTVPGAPVPSVIIGKSPFAPDCRVDGGGGVEEKIARFRAMREKATELQSEVNKMDNESAMNELVEDMWGAPSRRYERTAKRILNTKAFNIPLNAFPNNTVDAPNTTINKAPLGSFEAPEVLTGVENSITFNDSEPVIQFKHKNATGVMTAHQLLINKDSLLASLKASGDNQNRCFEPACNGYLWPEEIEQAFAHPLIAPSVTAEDKGKLAAYKERFYRNYVGGKRRVGGSTGDVFQSALNATCVVPPRPRGGRRLLRKTHKRRRGRKAGTRKTRH